MNVYPFEEQRFGFKWGPVTIIRAIADPKDGVTLILTTGAESMQIRCTPKGKIRAGEVEKQQSKKAGAK